MEKPFKQSEYLSFLELLFDKINQSHLTCDEEMLKLSTYMEESFQAIFDEIKKIKSKELGHEASFETIAQALQSSDRCDQSVQFIRKKLFLTGELIEIVRETLKLIEKNKGKEMLKISEFKEKLQTLEKKYQGHNALEGLNVKKPFEGSSEEEWF